MRKAVEFLAGRAFIDDPQIPGSIGYIHAADESKMHGHGYAMLAEIVPDCPGEPADEQAAAKCPRTHIAIPKLGEHVAMNGPWVFDSNHGWYEIHPVDSITT